MSKRSHTPEPWEETTAAEPGSRLRVRSSDDERLVDDLHERFVAGELTADEVAERIKNLSIARARAELSDSDFRAFEQHMRTAFEMPNLEKLRRD